MTMQHIIQSVRRVGLRVALAGLVALGTLGVAQTAEAVTPVPQGTFALAAERITGFGLTFPGNGGDVNFNANLLMSGSDIGNFSRVGGDYFVIDGLSIGANLGLSFHGGVSITQLLALPRVGYAFSLSPAIDFWPRLGVGVYGMFGNGGSSTSGLLNLEGMFVWNALPQVGIEFGPTLDVFLASNWPVVLGANAGIVVRF